MVRQDGTGNPKSRRHWHIAFAVWGGLFIGLSTVPSIMFDLTGWEKILSMAPIIFAGTRWFILPSFVKMACQSNRRDAFTPWRGWRSEKPPQ